MKHSNHELVQQLLLTARQDERKRAFHLFHNADEQFNRMLIAGIRGSYATPHRHTTKLEVFTYVSGDLTVVEFNDDGSLKNAYDLSQNPYVEVQPMTWHAVLFGSDEWAFMEMAHWPEAYDPTDKEFAPWAPAEGDSATGAYVDRLLNDAAKLFSTK